MFLRFVSGRKRLPVSIKICRGPTGKSTSRKFADCTNAHIIGPRANALLPVAHTCFYQLILPDYSDEHIMARKLRYASYNCAGIDLDEQYL